MQIDGLRVRFRFGQLLRSVCHLPPGRSVDRVLCAIRHPPTLEIYVRCYSCCVASSAMLVTFQGSRLVGAQNLCTRHQHRSSVAARASDSQTGSQSASIGLPTGPDSTIRQAAAAITTAFRDGVARQLVEMPLPLTGATELDDW